MEEIEFDNENENDLTYLKSYLKLLNKNKLYNSKSLDEFDHNDAVIKTISHDF